jgi:hypothetical protein
VFEVRPSRCGRGAELADPCGAALILIIRVLTFTTDSDLPLGSVRSLKSRQSVALTTTINRTCPPVFARHGSGSSVILERNDFGKERRFGACRGEHSLNVVKQAAPTYQMLPALRAKSEEAMQESEQHRNRKVARRTFPGPICGRKTGREIRTRHSKS